MGTPKHPMFLLGKTYKDADSKPDQATIQRPHARALRTWWHARKGPASNSDSAAFREVSNSSRVLHNSEPPIVSAMHDQHKQPSKLPELAANGESSASSLPSSSTSFSSTTSVPEPNIPFQQSASMPSHGNASQSALQRDSQLPSDVSQIPTALSTDPIGSRRTVFSPLAQNAAANKHQTRPQNIMPGPQRQTHTAPDQAPAASAIDLEAQNSLPMQQNHADTAQDAAASTTSDSLDTESDWAGIEPSDVAAERARVDALWTKRQSPTEGIVTGSSSQPAILLHNLRKVSISVYKISSYARSGDIKEILLCVVICLPVCLAVWIFQRFSKGSLEISLFPSLFYVILSQLPPSCMHTAAVTGCCLCVSFVLKLRLDARHSGRCCLCPCQEAPTQCFFCTSCILRTSTGASH